MDAENQYLWHNDNDIAVNVRNDLKPDQKSYDVKFTFEWLWYSKGRKLISNELWSDMCIISTFDEMIAFFFHWKCVPKSFFGDSIHFYPCDMSKLQLCQGILMVT